MISTLCVTRAELHAWPFLVGMRQLMDSMGGELVVAADGVDAYARMLARRVAHRVVQVRLQGNGSEWYQKNTLDEAVAACTGDYILRLDDDECCSVPMQQWLRGRLYLFEPLWSFPRAWLWDDAQHYIVSKPFWPDHQVRLARRDAIVIPQGIHGGAFDGQACTTSVWIEHHKLLVRTVEERRALVAFYNSVRPGAGLSEFYLPDERSMTVERLAC